MKKIFLLVLFLCSFSLTLKPSICIVHTMCGDGIMLSCNGTDDYAFCEAQVGLRVCCDGVCEYCEGPT